MSLKYNYSFKNFKKEKMNEIVKIAMNYVHKRVEGKEDENE